MQFNRISVSIQEIDKHTVRARESLGLYNIVFQEGEK